MNAFCLLGSLVALAMAQNYSTASCASAEAQCTKLKSKGFIFTSRAVPSNFASPYDSQQSATSPLAAATPLPTATAFYNYNLTSGNQTCGDSNCLAPIGSVCGNGTWINAIWSGSCVFCYCTNSNPLAYNAGYTTVFTSAPPTVLFTSWAPSPSPYTPTPSPYTTSPYSPSPSPYTPTPTPSPYTPSPYTPSPYPTQSYNSTFTGYTNLSSNYGFNVTYLPPTHSVGGAATCPPIFCFALSCTGGIESPPIDSRGCATGCAYCRYATPAPCPPPPQYCSELFCGNGTFAQASINERGCVVGCPFCSFGFATAAYATSANGTAYATTAPGYSTTFDFGFGWLANSTYYAAAPTPAPAYCGQKCVARFALTTSDVYTLAGLNATLSAKLARNVTVFQSYSGALYVDVEAIANATEVKTSATLKTALLKISPIKTVTAIKTDGALAREDEFTDDDASSSAVRGASLAVAVVVASLLRL